LLGVAVLQRRVARLGVREEVDLTGEAREGEGLEPCEISRRRAVLQMSPDEALDRTQALDERPHQQLFGVAPPRQGLGGRGGWGGAGGGARAAGGLPRGPPPRSCHPAPSTPAPGGCRRACRGTAPWWSPRRR